MLKTPIAIACPETCADYLDEEGIWCASSTEAARK